MMVLMAVAITAQAFAVRVLDDGSSLATIAATTAVLFGVLLLIALYIANRPTRWLTLVERLARRTLPVRIAERLVHGADGVVAGLAVLERPARVAGVGVWSLGPWSI